MPAPLLGKTVLVTRPRADCASMARLLREAGAKVVCLPLIEFKPPSSYRRLDRALRGLAGYRGAAFTSARAVECFFSRAKTLRIRKLPRPALLWAVGPETARALRRRGWTGAKAPASFRGKALARSITGVRGLRILVPRAEKGREELPAVLREKGARVDVVACYRTVARRKSQERLRAWRRPLHAAAFASGSSVDAFVQALGKVRARLLLRGAAAAIGSSTAQALRRHGIAPAIQARISTAEGLARAIIHG